MAAAIMPILAELELVQSDPVRTAMHKLRAHMAETPPVSPPWFTAKKVVNHTELFGLTLRCAQALADTKSLPPLEQMIEEEGNETLEVLRVLLFRCLGEMGHTMPNYDMGPGLRKSWYELHKEFVQQQTVPAR